MAEAATSPTLPSLRELELEQLLRKREQQLVDLTTELKGLRSRVNDTSKDEWHNEQAISKAAMAVLLPHLVNERNAALGSGPSGGVVHSGLVSALRQRTGMLQEENDELYTVLRRAETGRLDEEVKGLRRLVAKLERSLKESDETVKYLTEELESVTEATTRRVQAQTEDQRLSPPHVSKHRNVSPHESITSSSSKPPYNQNGSRSHKKPRMHLSPEPNTRQDNYGERRHPQRDHSSDRRDRGPLPAPNRSAPMEVDRRERERSRDERDRPLPPRDRDRERIPDRDRAHRRDRDSPRARDEPTDAPPEMNGLQIRGYARSRANDARSPRRGGAPQGQNTRSNGLPNRPDRGLAERLGL